MHGLAALLVLGMGCVSEAPRDRPATLTAPVTSCAAGSQQGRFQLPVWDLFVLDRDWDSLHADVAADIEVDAQLCIDGVLEPIELELQGTSGRLRDKKSFKLKLDRDRTLAEMGFAADSPEPQERHQLIDKVYLKAVWIDQSLIREAVAFDLWREMGHRAPRTGFANLRINGDYWGLYTVVEPVDKDYLRRNGYPDGGSLFKATRKHGSRADFAVGRDLEKAFEDKSDDDDDDDGLARARLEALVRTLQGTPLDQASFERDIDPIFPLDDYLDRMVWVAFTRNGDAVAQNFYLYDAPRDGHDFWYQIPWDSDLCMGSNWRDRDIAVPADVSLLIDGGNYFSRRLTMVPGIRDRYVARFLEVLDEVLTEPVVMSHLERRAARVRSDLSEDQRRWNRVVTPDEAFDVIRDFVSERPAVLRQALVEMSAQPLDPVVPTASLPDDREEVD